MQILGAIILVVLVIALAPMVTIWSLNTLFHLGVEITFGTWFATLWLFGLIGHRINQKGK